MMNKFLKYSQPQDLNPRNKISYSQYAMYNQCPRKWELSYIKQLRNSKPSIHTVFGTAMHNVIQEYITVMFTDTVTKADNLDLESMLQCEMASVYQEDKEKCGEHFSNKFEMREFYEDGVAILKDFKKKKGAFFNKKHYELVGIELPIYYPTFQDNKHIVTVGFLDVVLRDKRDNVVTIFDLKTSTRGWNKYQKADKIKTAQLVLYKQKFSEQYKHPIDKIKVEYIILKRKLIEGAMFPQKRITSFIPASGRVTQNRLSRTLRSFIDNAFDEDGDYNTNRKYMPVAGKNYKNCKFCEFANNQELCPKANRITE